MPDNCKIMVEPMLQEKVPTIKLPISENARKKFKQQQEIEKLKSLPLEDRLLNTFKELTKKEEIK